MLYDENYSAMLLGCLAQDLSIFYNPQYPLAKDDFSPEPFHQVIHFALKKLAESGANEATEIDVDSILQSYPEEYEIASDSNFLDFVVTIRELAVKDNLPMYYDIVRKFSLLRNLKKTGYNIKKFYDETDETNARAKLNSLSIRDILDKIELTQSKIRAYYDVQYVKDELRAGEDVEERLQSFKERPAFGALLQSGYLSTLFNGWNEGHLGLRAGPSSSGKTRCSVADLVNVGATQLYSDLYKDFVPNGNYRSPTLFIATEQKIDTEVEPMFWAAISGVEYRKITNGTCTREEEYRVIKAGEILKESNLHICSMPNFTSASLKRKLKEMKDGEGIKYAIFDYMEQQSDISQEYKNNVGNSGRQDQILLSLATDLKQYAEFFNIGILTGQQLNDAWKQMPFVDESALAGGKATKNKVDWGSVIIPTSCCKRDLHEIELLCQREGYGDDRAPLPNIVEFIFKSRYGAYGDQRLKLWSYFDRGTFRRKDYFVTNDQNEIVNVPISALEDF